MSDRSQGRLGRQVQQLRSRQQQEPGMPFCDILKPSTVRRVIEEVGGHVRQCLFTPVVTFYAFLAQVLSADGSCREATAKLLAWQGASGQAGEEEASVQTGPYCKARARLPEELPSTLAGQVGRDLHESCDGGEPLLQGRPVKVVDGSTCSMPDTPENQAEYPQPRTQKPGLGFPILRFVVVLCLRCGAALDAAVGAYLGKQTGETALLRTLLDQFQAGDVVLGDRYFCSYWQIALFLQRGVDCLFRLHQRRKVDFRKGRRLGRYDHVVRWKKPPQRPAWMTQEMYDVFPAELAIREVKRRIAVKGFRVTQLLLATTLLDGELYPQEELARAFRVRWQAEVDLRSIKSALRMDVLRCKTPGMVRKELWMHLLGYNLVRTVMAQAAQREDRLPREISFTAALQLLRSFVPLMALLPERLARKMHEILLVALGKEVVGDRPDRYEPRAVKRRGKPHRLLNEPRAQARRRMEKSRA
jgi:hypothetical protein